LARVSARFTASSFLDISSICKVQGVVLVNVRVIPQCNVAARFGNRVCDCAADAFCCARHDGDFAFHAELLHYVGGCVWHGLGEARAGRLAFFDGHGHFGGSWEGVGYE